MFFCDVLTCNQDSGFGGSKEVRGLVCKASSPFTEILVMELIFSILSSNIDLFQPKSVVCFWGRTNSFQPMADRFFYV